MILSKLTVPWECHQTKVATVMSEWLNVLGKPATPYTLEEFLGENVLIIPYESWAHNGLSGSSVPSTVVLDYLSVTSAVVGRHDIKTHLREAYIRNNVDTSIRVYQHYDNDENLCGLIQGASTKNIGEVNCPHCLFEINFRLEPINDKPT